MAFTNDNTFIAPTDIEKVGIALPVDIQSYLSQTIQTHNAVVNPASASSAWIACDQFQWLAVHCNIAGATYQLDWSFDGSTVFDSDSYVQSGTVRSSRQYAVAPFVRLTLTATGTTSAYVYLSA